jgi:hypothetical protein
MTDEELITKVAELWVSNGGDAEGLGWCFLKLKQKIQELSEEVSDEKPADS